jgi:hypothetical protein
MEGRGLIAGRLQHRLKFGGRQDRDGCDMTQNGEVPVPRNQRTPTCSQGQLNEHRIIPVAAIERQIRRRLQQRNDLREGKIILQQYTLLRRGELEFRVGQDARQFLYCLTTDDGRETRRPGISQPGQASPKYQGRDDDIGIEYRPPQRRAQACLRPQATASATSWSVMPSSASLARTAAAPPTRAGVRTSLSPSTTTSKWLGRPSASMTFAGSVSWFLDVSFASMSKIVRRRYALAKRSATG